MVKLLLYTFQLTENVEIIVNTILKHLHNIYCLLSIIIKHVHNLARADAKLAVILAKYAEIAIKQRKIDQDAIILVASCYNSERE